MIDWLFTGKLVPMVVVEIADPPILNAPFEEAVNWVNAVPMKLKLNPILVTEEATSSWLDPINWVVPELILTVAPFLSKTKEPVLLVENAYRLAFWA